MKRASLAVGVVAIVGVAVACFAIGIAPKPVSIRLSPPLGEKIPFEAKASSSLMTGTGAAEFTLGKSKSEGPVALVPSAGRREVLLDGSGKKVGEQIRSAKGPIDAGGAAYGIDHDLPLDVVLPTHPVRVGESWEIRIDESKRFRLQNGETVVTGRLEALRQGQATIRTTLNGKIVRSEWGGPSHITTRGEGLAVVSVVDGAPIHSEFTLSRETRQRDLVFESTVRRVLRRR